ncbi:MAG: DUF3106 domain-containing protein [Rhodoferax sp.]|nr:DUF3106 domain-containing protein [Rhodoferax sp.]
MVTSDALAQGVAATPLQATSAVKRVNPPAVTKASNTPMTSSQPTWQDLTPAQQVSLRPLAAHWSSLDSARKRKWIALAANYSALAPPEQAKLHSRMTEWASLSPKQRDQARLNFAQSKQISATQKAATWEAYQALSPEEKQKMAKSAPPKPAGAATAAKPVAPDKLTKIPLRKPTTRQASEVPAISQSVNRNTLLPQTKPLPQPKPTQ